MCKYPPYSGSRQCETNFISESIAVVGCCCNIPIALKTLLTGSKREIAWFRKLSRLISQRGFPLWMIFEVVRDPAVPLVFVRWVVCNLDQTHI